VLGPVLQPLLIPRGAAPAWINSNAALAGAAGQSAPSGCVIEKTSAQMTNSNAAYISDADGFGDWVEWTVTNESATRETFSLYQNTNGTWAQGTLLRGAGDLFYETVSGTGVRNVSMQFWNTANIVQQATCGYTSTANLLMRNGHATTLPAFSGRLQTGDYALPGVFSQIRMLANLTVYPLSSVRVRLRNLGFFTV
jgi:hypothetical protein